MSVRQRFEHRRNVLSQTLLQLVNFCFLIIFIEIIFSRVHSVAGWSGDQMQFLGALAQISSIIYSSFLASGVSRLQESVRTGGFDFYLLKPLDAQVHCAFSRFNPVPLLGLSGPVVWIFFLVLKRDLSISWGMTPIAFALLIASVSIRYSFGIGTAVLSFLLTKVSALQSLQASLLSQSHYPVAIYSGWIKVFTLYMIPVALMANVPAALLLNGNIDSRTFILLGYSTLSLLGSRLLYLKLVGKYASASS